MDIITRVQNRKQMVCCNPDCPDPRPWDVAHDTLRFTCGICTQAGYTPPRMEQPELPAAETAEPAPSEPSEAR